LISEVLNVEAESYCPLIVKDYKECSTPEIYILKKYWPNIFIIV